MTQFPTKKQYLLILILVLIFNSSLQESPNYLIPSYFGSKELDFLEKQYVSQAKIGTFYWKQRIDLSSDPDIQYYFVDKEHNVIMAQNSDGQFKRVVGKYKVSGYRDGNYKNTLFNQPHSLAYFRKNKRQALLEENHKIVIMLKDASEQCLNVDKFNYTNCQLNYKYVDNGIKLDEKDPIDLELIKSIYINDADDEPDLPDEDEFEEPVLYITDEQNNCIRKFNLVQQITTTIAGQCGISGFKDGPLGINMFNKPRSIGVDVQGNIFVYDSGNNYIRMVDTQGEVKTLIKGSCRQDSRQDPIEYNDTYQVKPVICYLNWIKTYGDPTEHIFVDNVKGICSDHISECNESPKATKKRN